ncbi:MAG: hypothetical protein AB1705_11090, partial [Verrucomicrobiota bacterium]
REKFPDMPFIFVTGRHGEEAAVDALKRGATDYILKDGLTRLVPAVKRALRDAERKNKEYLRQMAELCPDALSATAAVAPAKVEARAA